jgi:hypothetical protein
MKLLIIQFVYWPTLNISHQLQADKHLYFTIDKRDKGARTRYIVTSTRPVVLEVGMLRRVEYGGATIALVWGES